MSPLRLFALAAAVLAAGLAAPAAGVAGPGPAVAPSAAPEWSPAAPSVPAREFSLRDFSPAADGRTPDTEAFRRALAAVAAAGGGRLVVPPGDYFTGPFELCGRLDFRLERGARLRFTQDPAAYRRPDGRWRPMIEARGCRDLELSGAGELDGQGAPWWVRERAAKTAARARGLPDAEIGRPRLIVLEDCERVRVAGLALRDSPQFHLSLVRCRDAAVEGISIRAPADSPNTDGIDPSGCARVLIRGCDIDTGDDCVALKAGSSGPIRDVRIEDCAFRHGHGCSIGSETTAGLDGLVVRRCTFDGTTAGIRLKSSRGRGGPVRNLEYSDLTMRGVGEAIVVSSFYEDRAFARTGDPGPARAAGPGTPDWSGIVVERLTADCVKDAGEITGLPESPVRGLVLRDVSIRAPRGLRLSRAEVVLVRSRVLAAAGPPFLGEAPTSR